MIVLNDVFVLNSFALLVAFELEFDDGSAAPEWVILLAGCKVMAPLVVPVTKGVIVADD